jgi:hypothetical protein
MSGGKTRVCTVYKIAEYMSSALRGQTDGIGQLVLLTSKKKIVLFQSHCSTIMLLFFLILVLGVLSHHVKNDLLYQKIINKKQPVVEKKIVSFLTYVLGLFCGTFYHC